MPKLTIDGRPIEVPVGTNLIEAARLAGVEIPYFCYHPYLSVVGQCRICMVEIEGQPRLVIACATPATDGMVVKSETSSKVKEAREAVMEFLLANHPLDCPVCDQAGECLLQDHAMTEQAAAFASNMVETRRTFPGFQRRLIGPHVVQNQNRCIHCSRCIRFTQEVSETGQLTYKSRGNHAYIDTFAGRPLEDPFSACVTDVCPVGALTLREFRFRKRAWKLLSTPSICPGCSIGCNLWIDHHERRVYRFTPRENSEINATWLCDHGRYLVEGIDQHDYTAPAKRGDGQLDQVSWTEALQALALSFQAARRLRVVASATLSNESLFLARELFSKHLKGEIVVPVSPGEPRRMKNGKNQWLTSTDAHPNAQGARALGLQIVDQEGLHRFLFGAAEVTVILDTNADPTLLEKDALRLLKVGCTVAFSRLSNPVAELASWVLPSASHACDEGTFVSSSGQVQRFTRAFTPPPSVRSVGVTLAALARELGAPHLDIPSPAEVFARMVQSEKTFSELKWDELVGQTEGSFRERQHG